MFKRKNTPKPDSQIQVTMSEDPFLAIDKRVDKPTYFALAKVPFDMFDGYHSRLMMRIYTILKGQN